jgi:hypothetical protein
MDSGRRKHELLRGWQRVQVAAGELDVVTGYER